MRGMNVPRDNRRHTDLRHRAEGFEARCRNCGEWLPLDLGHWAPSNGMARCKACIRAYQAAWERGKRGDEAWAEGVRENRRATYRANRETHLAATQAWRARNREHLTAYMRDYRARNRERLAADMREYRLRVNAKMTALAELANDAAAGIGGDSIPLLLPARPPRLTVTVVYREVGDAMSDHQPYSRHRRWRGWAAL